MAEHADWPVSEADLHARHRWLVAQKDFRKRMLTDPDFFDAKIAGWWVWGLSSWIGSGWCDVSRMTVPCQVHRLTGDQGINRAATRRQPPDIDIDGRAHGRGTRRKSNGGYTFMQRVRMGYGATAGVNAESRSNLLAEFEALASRLRRVRVVCGDWRRVLTLAVLSSNGFTGVLLDPPYASDLGIDSTVYSTRVGEFDTISARVREWALEHGAQKNLRIVLCGYEGEHEMLGWRCVEWEAQGGYGNRAGNKNRKRERLWLSPACTRKQLDLPAMVTT